MMGGVAVPCMWLPVCGGEYCCSAPGALLAATVFAAGAAACGFLVVEGTEGHCNTKPAGDEHGSRWQQGEWQLMIH